VLPRVIARLVGWAVSIFYEVERRGPPLPPGPVLLTANHPNALVDPLVIFHTAGRASKPLAKAPLFEQAFVGTLLRGLGGLPVYRRHDDPALMHLNERTFDAAIGALQDGAVVQIFPEGQSHSEPSMTPIRTGAARIALQSEERGGWRLGLHVQPVGLTYTKKSRFRGRVVAAFGDPFEVADLRESYTAGERAAVRTLTERIRERLEKLTLNYDHPDDAELVEVAERLYARQKNLVRYRERASMSQRLPRLQRFAEGVRWLRATDPDRLSTLRESVRRYLRLLTLLGASEGDVPPTYKPAVVTRYAIRQLFMLALVLPAAMVGVVTWAVPFTLTRRLPQRFRPELDQIASYKIAIALVTFPSWFAIMALAMYALFGVVTTVVAVVILPITGLAAIAWRDRQVQVRQDVRVFLRAMRHRRGRDRLGDLRRELVEEFDQLAEAWRLDREG